MNTTKRCFSRRISLVAFYMAMFIAACLGQDMTNEEKSSAVDWSEQDDFWTERSSESDEVKISPTESVTEGDGFQTSIIFTNLYLPDQESTEVVQGTTTDTPKELTTILDTALIKQETNETEPQRADFRLKESSGNMLVSSVKPEEAELDSTVSPNNTAGLVSDSIEGESNYTILSSSSDRTTLAPKSDPTSLSSVTLIDQIPYFSPYDEDSRRYMEEVHPCRRECLQEAQSMICHYNFTLEWYHTMSKACYDCPYNLSDCYRPDCVAVDGKKRIVATINRQIPGPPIEVCLGDTIVVRVDNRLGEATTSLHWHGLPQRETPHMDGVPSVTQCPISPGSTFVYTFNASTPGTHFYHSHSGIQRGDGAFGALVIRKPEVTELYDIDMGEHTLIVLDWSHGPGTSLLAGHLHAGGGNKPETLQINGRGRFEQFRDNASTPLATFSVTKGFRYRFRLINAGIMNCPIELSIDGHQLLVISSDGNDILPEKVDSLVSYAGERWDFVVSAEAAVGNYWIKARGLMDCDERFTLAHQEAVLHYTGAISVLPQARLSYDDTRRDGKVLNELNAARLDPSLTAVELEALSQTPDPALSETPDRTLVFSYDFHPKDNPHFFKTNQYGFKQVKDISHKIFTPQLNHVSMKLPPFPMLTQAGSLQPEDICSNQNQTDCALNYCECVNLINIRLNDVVEIILIDEGYTYDANHPFHLHGHTFRVVGMDRLGRNISTAAVLQLDAEGAIYRNLNNPPIKDTVTVPDGGYTIIRFHANNPGYWLFHCHIEFHVEVGMAVVFKVGEDSDMLPPPPGFPTCGDFEPEEKEIKEEKSEVDKTKSSTEIIETSTTLIPQKTHMSQINLTQNTTNQSQNITFGSVVPISNTLIPLNSSVKIQPISPRRNSTRWDKNVSENEILRKPNYLLRRHVGRSIYTSSASLILSNVTFVVLPFFLIQLLASHNKVEYT